MKTTMIHKKSGKQNQADDLRDRNGPSYSGLHVFSAAILFVLLVITIGTHALARPSKAAQMQTTLVIGLLSDPGTLNPLVASSTQAQDIIGRIFLKLLDEESDFITFRPRLARRWEFSPDSLAITFHLRKDVKWQDGVPCTAADVRFTWECQNDTTISWPERHLKERIENVEIIDDYTVIFHFTNRYPYQLMDANDGVILPKHILEGVPRNEFRTCAFGRHPVGNGPYRLIEWSSKQYVELERNPDYYEKDEPHIERVIFKIVPDMVTLYSQLKSGEIDCLESISPDEAEIIEKKNKEIKLYKYASRSMTFISWNLNKDIFKNRDIRRALAMAINRRAIVENLWRGNAVECTSPMHPILWAFDDSMEPIPYDPDTAREILAANGWRDRDNDGFLEKNGKPFAFEMIANYGNQQRVDIITMVQAQLATIGVKVKPRVLEWNTFIDKIVKFQYESCVMGWKVGTRADLTEFWHSSSIGHGGYNISGYSNKKVDRLIELARNTLATDLAKEKWSECQRIIYDDQPFLFLAIPYEINALNCRFVNVKPSPASFFHNLRKWKVRSPAH